LEQQASSDVRLVLGQFDIDGAPLTLISAHIARPNPPGVQQRELANLADIIHSYDRNDVILAGDFNATPWSFSLRRFDTDSGLTRHTRAIPTWPAQAWTRLNLPALFAFLPIDHIYSGAAWRPIMVRRGPRTSSDHYPIEATFRYEEAH
jgi:endonuclease/exonuclease/phosphatase (EEP) superfamily protein YafD